MILDYSAIPSFDIGGMSFWIFGSVPPPKPAQSSTQITRTVVGTGTAGQVGIAILGATVPGAASPVTTLESASQ